MYLLDKTKIDSALVSLNKIQFLEPHSRIVVRSEFRFEVAVLRVVLIELPDAVRRTNAVWNH